MTKIDISKGLDLKKGLDRFLNFSEALVILFFKNLKKPCGKCDTYADSLQNVYFPFFETMTITCYPMLKVEGPAEDVILI